MSKGWLIEEASTADTVEYIDDALMAQYLELSMDEPGGIIDGGDLATRFDGMDIYHPEPWDRDEALEFIAQHS